MIRKNSSAWVFSLLHVKVARLKFQDEIYHFSLANVVFLDPKTNSMHSIDSDTTLQIDQTDLKVAATKVIINLKSAAQISK